MMEINTTDFGITFRKGEVATGYPPGGKTYCGPGSAYPLEVTLGQLSEILYRVRDAYFTAGGATVAVVGPTSEVVYKFNAPSGDKQCSNAIRRGWCIDEADVVKPSLFGDAYTVNGKTVCDANKESVMFSEIPPGTGFLHTYNNVVEGNSQPVGYAFYSEDSLSGLIWNEPVIFVVLPEVAYVGDSPFSPSATLYLKLSCSVVFAGSMKFDPEFQGLEEVVEAVEVAKLTIELSAGNSVSCPLWGLDLGDVTHDDYVLTAKKWWPYGKGSPLSPVWDEDTGVML